MRVLITGSRHWKNVDQIRTELLLLQAEHGEDLVIAHGDSRGGGVDKMVRVLCHDLKIRQERFPVHALLDGNHRGAPLNRNKRMVDTFKPDLVLAFRSKGKSNGTDHTVAYAESKNYQTVIHTERTDYL